MAFFKGKCPVTQSEWDGVDVEDRSGEVDKIEDLDPQALLTVVTDAQGQGRGGGVRWRYG